MLNINCSEKFVSHNVHLSRTVSMTIKHEFMHVCSLVIGIMQVLTVDNDDDGDDGGDEDDDMCKA